MNLVVTAPGVVAGVHKVEKIRRRCKILGSRDREGDVSKGIPLVKSSSSFWPGQMEKSPEMCVQRRRHKGQCDLAAS